MMHSDLPSWADLLRRLGLPEPRRGRCCCPIHGGDSTSSLSLHEEKGFHCFVCHAHGSKIDFIMLLHRCDFKTALQWLGLEPGRPPKADPEVLRQMRIAKGSRLWATTTGRRLRGLHRAWFQVQGEAEKRLTADPHDPFAGALLYRAERNMDTLAEVLNLLDSYDPRDLRTAAELLGLGERRAA